MLLRDEVENRRRALQGDVASRPGGVDVSDLPISCAGGFRGLWRRGSDALSRPRRGR